MADNGIHGRDLIISTKDGGQCTAKLDDNTKQVKVTQADGSVASMELNDFQNWLVSNAKNMDIGGQPEADSFQKSAA